MPRLATINLIINDGAPVRAYRMNHEEETRNFRNLREFDDWWRPNYHGGDGKGRVNSQFLYTDVLLDRIDDPPAGRRRAPGTRGGGAGPRKRQQVEVRAIRYNSVYKAFEALGLSIPAHTKFRSELKRSPALALTYQERGEKYEFRIVE